MAKLGGPGEAMKSNPYSVVNTNYRYKQSLLRWSVYVNHQTANPDRAYRGNGPDSTRLGCWYNTILFQRIIPRCGRCHTHFVIWRHGRRTYVQMMHVIYKRREMKWHEICRLQTRPARTGRGQVVIKTCDHVDSGLKSGIGFRSGRKTNAIWTVADNGWLKFDVPQTIGFAPTHLRLIDTRDPRDFVEQKQGCYKNEARRICSWI